MEFSRRQFVLGGAAMFCPTSTLAAPHCPQIFGWIPIRVKMRPKWLNARATSCPAPRFTRPQEIDQWVNSHIRYRPDTSDIWATAAQTYARRFGDCEDIALLKRAMLISAGIPERDIFFIIARDTLSHRDHALIMTQGLILDSFNSLTLPMEKVSNYSPMLAFSGDNCWTFGRRILSPHRPSATITR